MKRRLIEFFDFVFKMVLISFFGFVIITYIMIMSSIVYGGIIELFK